MKNYIPKHGLAFYTKPGTTAPRNFTTEMLQTLKGYQQTAPGYLSLEQQYQPQYANLHNQVNATSLFGTDTGGVHTPGSLELGSQANTYNRTSDVGDVSMLGPSVTAAQLNANPYLAGGLQNLYGRMNNSPILNALNQQAQGQLAQNGQLSNEDLRNATQQSRTGFADRGMFGGNQSLAGDILGRQSLVDARRAQAQQLAGSVQGLNNQQNDFVGRGSQIFSTALADPFSVLLGRTGGAYGGQGGSGTQQIGTGSQLFNPTNPYAGDIYGSNQNLAYTQNVNNANAQNAQTSGYLNLGLSLLNGLGGLGG